MMRSLLRVDESETGESGPDNILAESVIEKNVSSESCIRVLGSDIHLISVDRTVDYIERWIKNRSGKCHTIVVSGFHGLLEAFKNPTLRMILTSAELWVPDGIAPVWVARIRGYKNVRRVPGVEIMQEVFGRANTKGYRSYFYGDTNDTLCALQQMLRIRYPGHKVAGAFSPPFRNLTADEDDEIIEQINAARPDILWIGLGMPKQEMWIYRRRDRLKVPVVIGVGAAFAFLAGTVSRCPAWLGSLGFEWVYRFLREPKKLWRRDLLDGPQFLFYVGREILLRRDSRAVETDSART